MACSSQKPFRSELAALPGEMGVVSRGTQKWILEARTKWNHYLGMCLYMFMYLYLYMYLYMFYVHIFLCIYEVSLHTYIHTYMHPCIHTYIHTYTLRIWGLGSLWACHSRWIARWLAR